MKTNSHHNLPERSVSDISHAIKALVEENFSYVRIRGEISGAKLAPSGHLYLTLKDDNANLSAVCWRGNVSRLQIRPEDGLEVVCTGRITTFSGQSKYQLVIDQMEVAGVGALMALLEKRKKQLAAEGLFDASRKKPIPFLPKTIGVVTSPTGAVIRDILHRIRDRFPSHVLVWPVLVQGDEAKGQIAAAINGFNAMEHRPDVLIIARGGGSIEDLWAFNEEEVIRAAAACEIPIISAIGHETDTTLLDHVADLRAPTPTGAAEKAVPVRAELIAGIIDYARRLDSATARFLEQKKTELATLYRALPKPTRVLDEKAQSLDHISLRLQHTLPRFIEAMTQRLQLLSAKLTPPTQKIEYYTPLIERLGQQLHNAYATLLERKTAELTTQHKLLESYHYKRVLERGYALVWDQSGAPITKTSQSRSGQDIAIELQDGTIKSIVT